MTDFSLIEKNLLDRGYTVRIFETKEQAGAYLVSEIKNTTVGIGGSQTIDSLDIFDALSKDNTVYWHWKQDAGVRKKAAFAAVYLTSVNGASETGELVNIDGAGNRVAASVFGHEKVYFVFGRNKIEPTLEKAADRARNIAAPKNAARLCKNTPCARSESGCFDCKSPERICRALCVHFGPTMGMKAEAVIIDEDLGM